MAAAQTAPADRVTRLPNVEGSLPDMAMPSMMTSEKQHRDTSVELMEAASCDFTACTHSEGVLKGPAHPGASNFKEEMRDWSHRMTPIHA